MYSVQTTDGLRTWEPEYEDLACQAMHETDGVPGDCTLPDDGPVEITEGVADAVHAQYDELVIETHGPQPEEEEEVSRDISEDLEDLEGVSSELADVLELGGYRWYDDIREASIEELIEFEEIDTTLAEDMKIQLTEE